MRKLAGLLVAAGSVAVFALATPQVTELEAQSCATATFYNGDIMCQWLECDYDGDGYMDSSTFIGCLEKDENGTWVPINHDLE